MVGPEAQRGDGRRGKPGEDREADRALAVDGARAASAGVIVAARELEVVALVAVRGRELVDDAGLPSGRHTSWITNTSGSPRPRERAEEVVRRRSRRGNGRRP